ncbi:hypothetical protein [Rhodopirellula europaea]|jgi:hypothetical protein|nr:hypothetical protein [Rhodopirellula europaea]
MRGQRDKSRCDALPRYGAAQVTGTATVKTQADSMDSDEVIHVGGEIAPGVQFA